MARKASQTSSVRASGLFRYVDRSMVLIPAVASKVKTKPRSSAPTSLLSQRGSSGPKTLTEQMDIERARKQERASLPSSSTKLIDDGDEDIEEISNPFQVPSAPDVSTNPLRPSRFFNRPPSTEPIASQYESDSSASVVKRKRDDSEAISTPRISRKFRSGKENSRVDDDNVVVKPLRDREPVDDDLVTQEDGYISPRSDVDCDISSPVERLHLSDPEDLDVAGARRAGRGRRGGGADQDELSSPCTAYAIRTFKTAPSRAASYMEDSPTKGGAKIDDDRLVLVAETSSHRASGIAVDLRGMYRDDDEDEGDEDAEMEEEGIDSDDDRGRLDDDHERPTPNSSFGPITPPDGRQQGGLGPQSAMGRDAAHARDDIQEERDDDATVKENERRVALGWRQKYELQKAVSLHAEVSATGMTHYIRDV